MTPDEFRTAVTRGMSSSGCRVDDHGIVFDLDGPRWSVGRRDPEGGNDVFNVSGDAPIGPHAAQTTLNIARTWWRNHRHLRACHAAYGWLRGAEDDTRAPYHVDAVIALELARRGMPMGAFAEAMARRIGDTPRRGVARVMSRTWSTFNAHRIPDAFDVLCRRKELECPGRAFAGVGHLQFQLGCGNTPTMRATIEIGPGVMWHGAATPTLRLASFDAPDAVLVGMRGRHLAEVVRHPSFEVEGLVITNARRERTHATLTLRSPLVDVVADPDARATLSRLARA